jgi:hypothetical protein
MNFSGKIAQILNKMLKIALELWMKWKVDYRCSQFHMKLAIEAWLLRLPTTLKSAKSIQSTKPISTMELFPINFPLPRLVALVWFVLQLKAFSTIEKSFQTACVTFCDYTFNDNCISSEQTSHLISAAIHVPLKSIFRVNFAFLFVDLLGKW